MFRTVIKLKEDTPKEAAKEIRQLCIKAHDNYVGKVQIKDISPLSFIFEGGENEYNCLQLGSLNLKETQSFNKWVKTWQWEDEDPDESCDLIEILLKPVYYQGE